MIMSLDSKNIEKFARLAYELYLKEIDATLNVTAKSHLQIIKEYKLHTLVAEAGIYIFAIETNDEIVISCRGTMADESILHDFDPNGPGHIGMLAVKDMLLRKIDKLLSDKSLILCGHSLGGSFAQTIACFIIEEINNKDLTNIGNLEKLPIYIYQSPGISDLLKGKTESVIESASKLPEISLNVYIDTNDRISPFYNLIFSHFKNTHLSKKLSIISDPSGSSDPRSAHTRTFFDAKNQVEYDDSNPDYTRAFDFFLAARNILPHQVKRITDFAASSLSTTKR
tara:strand:- start:11180 stop:12028 length:849 start_codon:yes stop_codon:yes gene_type:complete